MSAPNFNRNLVLFRRLSTVDLIFFVQHLEVLSRAGFSLSAALETVASSVEKPFFKTVVTDLQQRIESGKTLSDALEHYPRLFPELFRSVIHAGEISGKLDVALKQLLIQLRKRHELISKVKNAMMYPAVVMSAMVLIGGGLVWFIFPKITLIYQDVDFELPLPTRIVMGISRLVTTKGWLIGLLLILFVIGFLMFYRSKNGKPVVHRILLHLPIIAPILRKVALAGFTRNLSSLLKTDIPINDTFVIIAKTVGLVPYRAELERVGAELEKGTAIHTALERRPDLFPPLVTRIIATGEKTGMLDTLTEEIAIFFEAEVSNTMDNLSTIIEPVLMLVLGVVVGGFAISILLPFYNLIGNF